MSGISGNRRGIFLLIAALLALSTIAGCDFDSKNNRCPDSPEPYTPCEFQDLSCSYAATLLCDEVRCECIMPAGDDRTWWSCTGDVLCSGSGTDD
ncbi:MAG: hypothetical protein ABIJ56_07910 [Pseudomonadota bacterium]